VNRILLTSLFISLSLLAVAAAPDKVSKQLEANYAAITVAFQHNDLNGIAKFLASDFTAHDIGGVAHLRSEVLKDFKTQMAIVKDVTWVRKVTNLSMSGKTALVTVSGKFNGWLMGANGKKQKIELLATAKDSWVDTGAKWLIKSTTVLKRTVTIDGKPMKLPGK